MINISSIRLGFANNSSSSHSILLRCKDDAKEESHDFGWQRFHLKSPENKINYLATMLSYSLPREISSEYKTSIVKEIFGIGDSDLDGERESYIDHESVFPIPYDWDLKNLNIEFINDLKEFILREDISIGGGNDNKYGDEQAWNAEDLIEFGIENDSYPVKFLTAKKDGDWWILFNRKTGAKVRMSFNLDATPYTRASSPELIDIKITDYCPHGCPFCYMDSTTKGEHADYGFIKSIIWELEKHKVFEVALGGGEPSMHPEFSDILNSLKWAGIVANFTTFNMAFTKDEKLKHSIIENVKSFAMSSLREKDILSLYEWNQQFRGNQFDDKGPLGTLQIPLGGYQEYEVKNALKLASSLSIPVTFLGFKDFGRGKDFKPEDYRWLIDFIKKEGDTWNRFGADTLFVQQFKKELDELGCNDKLRVGNEGQFSCYIDAVNKKMGASSYTDKLHKIKVDKDGRLVSEKLMERFPYDVE